MARSTKQIAPHVDTLKAYRFGGITFNLTECSYIERLEARLDRAYDSDLRKILGLIDAEPDWFRNRYYVQRLVKQIQNELDLRDRAKGAAQPRQPHQACAQHGKQWCPACNPAYADRVSA